MYPKALINLLLSTYFEMIKCDFQNICWIEAKLYYWLHLVPQKKTFLKSICSLYWRGRSICFTNLAVQSLLQNVYLLGWLIFFLIKCQKMIKIQDGIRPYRTEKRSKIDRLYMYLYLILNPNQAKLFWPLRNQGGRNQDALVFATLSCSLFS